MQDEQAHQTITFAYFGGCVAYLASLVASLNRYLLINYLKVDILQEWKLIHESDQQQAKVIQSERKKLLETKLYQLIKSLNTQNPQQFKDSNR
jgi:hypothetical protein